MRSHADAAAVAALSAIALLLSGCGSNSSTNPLTGFDPAATVQTVAALTSITPDTDAIGSLQLVDTAFRAVTSATVVPMSGERVGMFGMALLLKLQRAAALAPAAVSLPASFLGKTLIYDPSMSGYKVDDTATGAPTDGVRLIYYSIEPTGQPVLPLDSLGYIDLTEQSTASTKALRMQVLQTSGGTPLIVADYDLEHSATASSTADHVTLQGYVTDGSDQIDIDLSEDFAEVGTDAILAFVTTLKNGATGESVEFTERDSITATGGGKDVVQLTVDGDEGTMVFDATGTPSGSSFLLDGTITFGGTEVATIGGTSVSPSFANPDGSSLPSTDQARLRQLWVALSVVFEYGFSRVSQLFLIAP